MKILHYVDAESISWAVPYIEHIKSLEGFGVENILLCRSGGNLEKLADENNIKFFAFKPLISNLPLLSPNFVKIVKKISPNIIHTRLSSAAGIAGFWKVFHHLPVISTVDKYPKLKYYKNSTYILPCSESVEKFMADSGIPTDKMTAIHNSVNVKFYSRDEKIRNEIRKSENLDNNKICFLGMGRLTDWKGFDILLKGFAEFLKCQEYPQKFILWIAGDGEERENLENLAKELNINEHVKFLGFVDDVRKILWASDVYVHPSKEDEPFGLSLLQAMSAGLPVIASQSGGIPEMLNRSQGLLFPKSDVQKLSECMNEIITKINSLSELSLERAKDFDVSVIAKKVYEVYEKFI